MRVDTSSVIADEFFAALMAPFGPFPREADGFSGAVAVSGGADSLCLALLAHRWRPSIVALIVDHGLREESASEAQVTREKLLSRGMFAHILQIQPFLKTSGIQSQARAARYNAMTRWCREHGVIDLLVAHHRQDQAETVLLRKEGRSNSYGLAGMALSRFTPDVRIIRPLLAVAPERLRATLRAWGESWIEDPSNQNAKFRRVSLRQSLTSRDMDRALSTRQTMAALRKKEDSAHAERCADVTCHPFGFIIFRDALPPVHTLARCWQAVAGAPFAPSVKRLSQLETRPGTLTLGGAWLLLRGREGCQVQEWCLVREPAAASEVISSSDAIPAGTVWDRRWRLSDEISSAYSIRKLGVAASRFKTRETPSRFIAALPAIWRGDRVVCVPHLEFCVERDLERIRFHAWREASVTDPSDWL